MRTNFSTGEFYDSLENEGLLTPIHGVVQACDQLLSHQTATSGECFEIGPNHDFGQGAVNPKFPDYIDEKSKRVFEKLAQRGQAKSALSSRARL